MPRKKEPREITAAYIGRIRLQAGAIVDGSTTDRFHHRVAILNWAVYAMLSDGRVFGFEHRSTAENYGQVLPLRFVRRLMSKGTLIDAPRSVSNTPSGVQP